MGRVQIKGGVWRNTEDEILKAAVMKYGKNQWSRIASLLHRKSAKQCKARWFEWLDPSIKKTEWSREEEEKLINLVRLMPTQWRTIASIVGRTASQCLEHYEQLLDQVQNKDKNILDDPRKLKPGEIDPNPETKPARPDPKDMDEDELEMLSEARARLANTQGKKAKRKAREKQLEEARRLAQLQKRRELRMAGINLQIRNWKNKRFIDYNTEIPFEKPVPAGFHNTADDVYEPSGLDFKRLRQQQLDGELPSVREERERKKDKQKLKEKKENGMPTSLMNNNEFQRPRSKLVLPEPAISDMEIEQVVKLGRASEQIKDAAEESGNIASETLLADYSITSSVNSIRTPKSAALSRDNIMAETKNLLALQNVDTPLLGGQNMPLVDVEQAAKTPAGLTAGMTPNTMISTPFRSTRSNAPSNSTALTPAGKNQPGFTPLTTPVRDKLAINAEESLALDNIQNAKQYTKEVKENLRKAFSQLPQPKNEYEIVMNNDDAEQLNKDDDFNNVADMDQSEVDEQNRQKELARIMKEEKFTQAVQKDLPRPCDVRGTLMQQPTTATGPLADAEILIKNEMIKLLHFDALINPTDEQTAFAAFKSKNAKNESKTHEAMLANYLEKHPIETIEDEYLTSAKKLINDEMELLKESMEHEKLTAVEEAKIWDECYSQLLYLPSQNRYTKASMVSKKDRIDSIETRWEHNRLHMTREAKRAGKIEKKLSILLGGYQSIADDLIKQFRETGQAMEQSHLELHSFKALKVREDSAIVKRISALEEDVRRQNEREKLLQKRYEELSRKKEELLECLQQKSATEQ